MWSVITNVSVRDTADQPVARAEFRVSMFLHACGTNQEPREWAYGRTNATGHSRLEVVGTRGPDTMQCVVLTVNPTGDPAYPGGTREFPAQLQFLPMGPGPRDSLRLDIVVP